MQIPAMMQLPELSEKSLSLFALGLALFGLLALYFWPQTAAYEPTPPALAAIAEDGARVEVAGVVASVSEKQSSTSIKICDASGECVSVSAARNANADFAIMKGDSVVADGIVSSYRGAKFVRADRIRHG